MFVISSVVVGLLVVGIVLMGRRPAPVDVGDVVSTRDSSATSEAKGTSAAPLPPIHPEPAPEIPSSPPGGAAQSPSAELSTAHGSVVEPPESPKAPEPVEVVAAEAPGPSGGEPDPEPSPERSAPQETARWREEVLGALAALDFSTLESFLEAGRAKGVPDEARSALEAECREVRGVWDELHSALETAAKRTTLCDVTRDGSLVSVAPSATLRVPLRSELGLKVVALDGDAAELTDGRGRSLGVVRAASLPDEVLVRILVGIRSPPPDQEREARRRLARLLLHVEGPERALACLGEDGSAVESPIAVAGADAEPGLWLRRRVRTLALRRLQLEKSGEEEPRVWARLSGEIFSLLAATTPASVNDGLIQRLRRDFLKARESSLPLEALFGASKVERLQDGRVRLTYDLKNEKTALEQAADLHAVGFQTEAPRYVRGRLVLQGEYRLLEGEPFVDRLSVEGKAVPMTPDSPNVNVALWTQSTDAVTCLDGDAASWFSLLRQNPGQPSDYFVFGMGYRTVTWRLVDQPAEQVVLAGSREAIPLPAHVLLGGARGASLHKDLGECLFAEAAPSERTRRVDFLVDLDEGQVTWRVNGRVLALDADDVRARLEAQSPRTGSVSILTNGRPVAFEALEVVGRLAEQWVETRTQEHVAQELAREVPGLASP